MTSMNPSFPFKLHDLLETAQKQNFEDIISWVGSNAFKVHSRDAFEHYVAPTYFSGFKYRSFQRQLSLYGFKQKEDNHEHRLGTNAIYTHPLLIRGKPYLFNDMNRDAIKEMGKSYRNQSSDSSEISKGESSPSPRLPSIFSDNKTQNANASRRWPQETQSSDVSEYLTLFAKRSCEYLKINAQEFTSHWQSPTVSPSDFLDSWKPYDDLLQSIEGASTKASSEDRYDDQFVQFPFTSYDATNTMQKDGSNQNDKKGHSESHFHRPSKNTFDPISAHGSNTQPENPDTDASLR